MQTCPCVCDMLKMGFTKRFTEQWLWVMQEVIKYSHAKEKIDGTVALTFFYYSAMASYQGDPLLLKIRQ